MKHKLIGDTEDPMSCKWQASPPAVILPIMNGSLL